MKHRFLLLPLLLGLTACTEEITQENSQETGITIPPPGNTVTNVSGGGGQTTVNLGSSTEWKAESNQDWCIVSNAFGTAGENLTVSVMPNFTGKERNAFITLYKPEGNKPMAFLAMKADTTATETPADTTAAEDKNVFVVHQDANEVPTEKAVYITGADYGANYLNVTLRATADGALYESVDGLNYVSSGNDLNIPANIGIGTTADTRVQILGNNMSWKDRNTFWLTGNNTGEICLNLNCSPAAKQKIYLKQSDTYRLVTNELPGDATAARLSFRLGKTVYFGGGLKGVRSGVYTSTNEWSTAFYALDTESGQVTAKTDLKDEQREMTATVVGGTVYGMTPNGSLYRYNADNDAWSYVQIVNGATGIDRLYNVNDKLYAVSINNRLVYEIYQTQDGWAAKSYYSLINGNYATVTVVNESAGRAYLNLSGTLFTHDAAKGIQKTADVSGNAIGAWNGRYYYRKDAQTIAWIDTNSGENGLLPVFNHVNYVDRRPFHAGIPVMCDGVAYILAAGSSQYGAPQVSYGQGTKIYRLDLAGFKPYSVEIR